MIILAIDPATITGYAIARLSWEYTSPPIIGSGEWRWTSVDIYEYGTIVVDLSSKFQGDHCIDLQNKIRKLIDDHSVDEICIEDFFFSRRFATGSTVNAAFRTAIHIVARELDIEYTVLNISLWKTFIAGRGTPTKLQKQKWGPALSKKIYMQDALWRSWGIRFPNHSISEKTGKAITFRYDVVDAVAQLIYYCSSQHGIPSEMITSTVDPGEDVIIKTTKPVYQYPADQ